MERGIYPCPCCGYLVFRMQPGGNERCPTCLWACELLGNCSLLPCRSPRMIDLARDKFAGSEFGQRSERRWPRSGEPQGRGEHNIEEPQRGIDYADSYPLADTTVLYYWRATYWRRFAS